MKRLILILTLFISFAAGAQTVYPTYNYQPWYYFKHRVNAGHFYADSTLSMPVRDTTYQPGNVGLLVFRPQDSSVYTSVGYTGQKWRKIGSGNSGIGSVTSVGLSMPSGFTVSNSPVTSSGTLTVTTSLNGLLRGTGSGFATVVISEPLTFTGGILGISQATSSQDGYITASAYTNFLSAYNKTVTGINVTGNNTKTITLTRQDGTTLTASFTDNEAAGGTGITTLNGQTESVQTFHTGSSGTDFNISSSAGQHYFNIPTGSATARGLLSTADWTKFNNALQKSDTAAMLSPYARAFDYYRKGETDAKYYHNMRQINGNTVAWMRPNGTEDTLVINTGGSTDSTMPGGKVDSLWAQGDTLYYSAGGLNYVFYIDSAGGGGGAGIDSLWRVSDTLKYRISGVIYSVPLASKIDNQNVADQGANFRISGTGQASSFISRSATTLANGYAMFNSSDPTAGARVRYNGNVLEFLTEGAVRLTLNNDRLTASSDIQAARQLRVGTSLGVQHNLSIPGTSIFGNRLYTSAEGIGGIDAVGTNITGQTLNLHGGRSTGSAVGGGVAIRTYAPGASGSTLNNTATTWAEWNSAGDMYLHKNKPSSGSVYLKLNSDGRVDTTSTGISSGSSTTWGSITGTLSDQTDLQAALNGKASTTHTHAFADITAKPATIAGYGITDAYTKTESDALYAPKRTYAPHTVTYSSTPAFNFTNSVNQVITLGGNITGITLSNIPDGETMYILFKQDATGGRTVAGWPSGSKIIGGALTLTTAANAEDLIGIKRWGSNYYITYGKDYK